ncbi:hypothetical protein B0H13DRAFT_2069876 [Mycena leptocephala]|nr:hypothetical protein B0H13DRAFT_2069876 [Mycena leptocephala]
MRASLTDCGISSTWQLIAFQNKSYSTFSSPLPHSYPSSHFPLISASPLRARSILWCLHLRSSQVDHHPNTPVAQFVGHECFSWSAPDFHRLKLIQTQIFFTFDVVSESRRLCFQILQQATPSRWNLQTVTAKALLFILRRQAPGETCHAADFSVTTHRSSTPLSLPLLLIHGHLSTHALPLPQYLILNSSVIFSRCSMA